jgi:hypothetical protein
LSEAQFLQFMTQMKSKVATQDEIVDALSVFDSSANKDGYVDTSSLKHAMLQMGALLRTATRGSRECVTQPPPRWLAKTRNAGILQTRSLCVVFRAV